MIRKENDVMPLSKAIEIILDIDSSDRLRTEAEGVLVRFALRQSCDDCISREAAIHAIMGQPSEAHYPDWYAEQIKELPSVKLAQSWTPCKEGLPKTNGRYFVTLHIYGQLDFKVDETVVKIIPFFDKWRVPTHIPEWINEALTQEVLAWMPLPKEYKESEE